MLWSYCFCGWTESRPLMAGSTSTLRASRTSAEKSVRATSLSDGDGAMPRRPTLPCLAHPESSAPASRASNHETRETPKLTIIFDHPILMVREIQWPQKSVLLPVLLE
eukprot:6177600-Pleurochrysis_carterae.AAC.2